MIAACDSATLAASWPVAMKIAVRPFAAWAPLLAEPARKAPACESAGRKEIPGVDPHQAPQHVAAEDRLGDDPPAPCRQHVHLRVLLVGVGVAGQEVAGAAGMVRLIHSQAAKVALPDMFWPAASPVV